MRILLRSTVATASCLLAATSIASAQCSAATRKLVTDLKYDEARSETQAQLKANPSDDALMHCMGTIFMEQNKSGDAADWFERATKANDKSAQHHLWLGNAVGDQAQHANKLKQPFLARRVKAEFERAVALDPTLIDARFGLVQFYTMAPGFMGGDADKATAQVAEIVKLNPMRGHIDAGWVAQERKDTVAVEREYLAAIAAAPDSSAGYTQLGALYRREKRWSEALATYERLLKARPDVIVAHLLIGVTLVEQKENAARAEREIKGWLADAPKDASIGNVSAAHQMLGVLYERDGKKDAARAEYQSAITINPRNEAAKKGLAALK